MAQWPQDMIRGTADWTEEDWADREYVEGYAAHSLKTEARNRYPEIIASISTSYSCELQSFEDRLNAEKKRLEPNAAPIAVLDLDKYVIGLAFGARNNKTIVGALLADKGIVAEDEKKFCDEFPPGSSYASNRLKSPLNNVGRGGFSFNPCYFTLFKKHKHAPMMRSKEEMVSCIVPSLDYAPSDALGLTAAQSASWLSAHEARHSLDGHFLNYQLKSGETPYMPDAERMLVSKRYREQGERLRRAEGYAEIGGLGTLVRGGEPAAIIDPVIDSRMQDRIFGYDMIDMLKAFKTGLNEMGIEKFRALDEDAANELYIATVEKCGLDDEELQLAAKMGLVAQLRNDDPANPLVTEIDALDDTQPHVIRAKQFMAYFTGNPVWQAPQETIPAATDPLLKEKQAQIDALDAAGELADRAFAHGGVVTPETMAHGFVAALETRRQQKKQGGDADLLNAEMIKLQTVFTSDPINYVAENRKRGLELAFQDNGVPIFLKLGETPQTKPAPISPSVLPGGKKHNINKSA